MPDEDELFITKIFVVLKNGFVPSDDLKDEIINSLYKPINTNGKKPIIWIDDPISSLDSNHIFFMYSLISEKIALNKNFEQLFISTHNLDFLKYLKRLRNTFIEAKSMKKWKGNDVLLQKEAKKERVYSIFQH